MCMVRVQSFPGGAGFFVNPFVLAVRNRLDGAAFVQALKFVGICDVVREKSDPGAGLLSTFRNFFIHVVRDQWAPGAGFLA